MDGQFVHEHNSLISTLSRKRKRTFSSSSYLDLLFPYLLFSTIYSLFAHPSVNSLDSLIRRGLSIHHKLVLDPYVLPPLNNAYHTSITPSIAAKVEQVGQVAKKVPFVAEPSPRLTSNVVGAA